jgi:hypothetical protein
MLVFSGLETAGLCRGLFDIKCAGKWKKCYCSGPFDCQGQLSLVLCTATRNTSGYDFATFRSKILQCRRIFVGDYQFGISAESTNLAPMKNSFFPSWGEASF